MHSSGLGRSRRLRVRRHAAATALSGLAEELRNTDKGERNQKLYKCAFRMGTMIARDWITRETVEQELEKAAEDCRLVKDDSRHSVRGTIRSGIDGGLKCPHEDLKDEEQPKTDDKLKTKLMQSSAEFVNNYVPPDYLIDGLLQRRYVYSMTAPTGFGKTTIALLIAFCVSLGLPLAGREVEKGRVLFFAGENPDDIRSRWIKLCEEMQRDPDTMDVVFMPFTLNLSQDAIRKQIDAEAAEHGPFSLLIVDTSAAYYSGSDENDNVQLGNHARMLRTFIELPGGPCVLVTCHPAKAYDLDNLLPRGGGAFLAEVDGNLVCVKDMRTQVVEVTTHGKFRGPEFSPFAFRLVAGRSDKLIDSKGRKIWSIIAVAISNQEQEQIQQQGHKQQDTLLRTMLDHPGSSLMELADRMGWLTIEGRPNKTRVFRVMQELMKVKPKLVEQKRDGGYVLTDKGTAEAEKTPESLVKEVKKEAKG